ncbi:MAG TPA: carboxymuconolactone decarboxylase family protein [Bryobacteraceae bacterium]|jgi:alkyl hydroperoxide reductase subunit D
MEQLLASIPEYAKDLKLNLQTVVKQPDLTEQQTWGTVVACALASRNPAVIAALLAEAESHLQSAAMEAAKGAAAIMGMNNIFYRFQHLSEHEKYSTLPARLRMNVIRSHGSDPIDFELWCVAVSAVNACGKCITAHDRTLREKGISEETVIAAIRIASVVHAISALPGL